MSFTISFTLYVNGEPLPEDVTRVLTTLHIRPRGAKSRYNNLNPLTRRVQYSYDLYDGPEDMLFSDGWVHIAGLYWVSPDNLLFTVRIN